MSSGSHRSMGVGALQYRMRTAHIATWLGAAALSLAGCAAQQEETASLPGSSARESAQRGVVADPARKELVIELGPLDLPARASHHAAPQPPPLVATLPVDGWLHGYEVTLEDGKGEPVPRRVIHHVNLIVPGKRELFSPIMLRIGAAGPETEPVKLPRLLGYRVHRGDSLLVTAMVHNPEPRSYQDVRLRVRLPYTPSRGGAWMSPLSIFPFYMDVMPPAGLHAYDLPAGRSEKSWEARPAVAGRILGVGGHLHKYGVALRLEDVTEREVVWEATPTLDENGNVAEMPTSMFIHRLGIRVRPDHVYRLTAVYENPTGRVIPDGAMGALGGVFLPDRGADWPAVDRGDAEYQKDVAVTYRSGDPDQPGRHEGGGHAHDSH